MTGNMMNKPDVHRRSHMLSYTSMILGSMVGPVWDLPKILQFLALAGEKLLSQSARPRFRCLECIAVANILHFLALAGEKLLSQSAGPRFRCSECFAAA